MSFTVTLSQDISGSLVSGTPLTLDPAATGQSASLTFTLSSAQTVALNLGALSLNPSSTTVYVYVYNSSGAQIANQGSSSGETINLPNLAAGTYTVVVTDGSSSPATGSLQVTLEPGVGEPSARPHQETEGIFPLRLWDRTLISPSQLMQGTTIPSLSPASPSISLGELGHPVCLCAKRPIHHLYKLLLVLRRLRDSSSRSPANRHLFYYREPRRTGHDELHSDTVTRRER